MTNHRYTPEEQKRLAELNVETAIRAHDLNRQQSADMNKAAIDAAAIAIRSLILVNGGAVVALLAFVGAIETGSSSASIQADELVSPIFWFAFGVGIATLTAALAYVVHLLDDLLTSMVTLEWEHPYVIETGNHKTVARWRHCVHGLALLCALGGLAAFFKGVFSVSDAIRNLGI